MRRARSIFVVQCNEFEAFETQCDVMKFRNDIGGVSASRGSVEHERAVEVEGSFLVECGQGQMARKKGITHGWRRGRKTEHDGDEYEHA